MQKIEYLIKHNDFVQKTYVKVLSLVFRFIGLFVRPNPKQIMFQSMIGKTYGDSPKVLFDQIQADPAFADYQYVWAFADPDRFEVENARKVKLNSLRYFLETMKSGVWITNVDMERGLHYKSSKTLYLNTWHGIPIKVIGNSQKNRNDYNYYDVDMMCCSSDFERVIFERDFNVPSEAIVKCGMPRNDELYSVTPEQIKQYRKEFNIPEGKKVILYCPTWRDSADGGASYQIAPPIDIDYWQQKLGSEYVVLFRMHHLTTAMLGIQFNDFARDVSHAPAINKLLAIADVLISDYSATIFDYAILEKPVLSFAYDLESYAFSRGFYEQLDRDVLPGSVFKTEQEVVEHILNMDYACECAKTRRIKEKYIATNGQATRSCLEFLKMRLCR
ncbi:MAG: CDP-glycerol glycerophosphotransferase family protein [Clostridia bacterium]|nr:CDP-glycerol glycerophosphotransferase family protein [Clostridia bacterium]